MLTTLPDQAPGRHYGQLIQRFVFAHYLITKHSLGKSDKFLSNELITDFLQVYAMRFFSTFILAAGLTLSAYADTAGSPAIEQTATSVAEILPVWQPEGPTQIRFEVLRKGKHFGHHYVSFKLAEDGGFTATADIELTAKIGPLTVYKYRHESVETWKGGQIIGLEAETRKEGDDIEARASITENGLLVEGTNYSGLYPAEIIPANHWNVSQLYTSKMLSTEGGQPLDVVATNLGREILTINKQEIEATKFRLDSELSIFLWYDDDGRWLKLSFTARGQEIAYILEDLY